MKVQEKDSDRKAEVHLNAQEKVNELEEYGEYVDPNDNALCCYVPVEEGMVVKVSGRFHGTTMTFAYDVAIDGILRGACFYSGKSITAHKSKRIEFTKFLVQTDDGVLETNIKVAPISITTFTEGQDSETIGTVEFRLFVLRSFGDDHPVGDIKSYYNRPGGSDEVSGSANYKGKIVPEYVMKFEEDSPLLDKSYANRLRSKMNAKRPGKHPWAIFRFHYRSLESITTMKMKQSHGPEREAKSEYHTLKMEPVPLLLVGAKPAKADDMENSTRASSPSPSPSIPPTSPMAFKKPGRQSVSSTSAKEDGPRTSDPSPSPDLRRSIGENGDDEKEESCAMASFEADKASMTTEVTAEGIAIEKVPSPQAMHGTAATESKEKIEIPTKNQPLNPFSSTKDKPETVATSGASVSSEGNTRESANTAVGPVEKPADTPVPAPKPATTPAKRLAKYASVHQKKQSATPASTPKAKTKPPRVPSVLPAKRPSELNVSGSSQLKSARPAQNGPDEPVAAITPAPRPSSASSTTKSKSKTPSLSDMRKQLNQIQQKRQKMADEQAKIDAELAPHKQKIMEVMGRLEKELEEEKRAMADQERQLEEDAAILAEFKSAEGGV